MLCFDKNLVSPLNASFELCSCPKTWFFFIGIIDEGEINLVSWETRRSVLTENKSMILAAERTHRRDPLNNFKYYKGGWSISEKHYFYVSLISMWKLLVNFLLHSFSFSFGLMILPELCFFDAVCCLYCCSSIFNYCNMVSGIRCDLIAHLCSPLLLPTGELWLFSNCLCTFSCLSHILHSCCNVNPTPSLSLWVLYIHIHALKWTVSKLFFSFNGFSVGCIVLYTGQEKFHSSSTSTLKYVVNQADNTVENLTIVSDYLSAAKGVGVDQIFLPASIHNSINKVDSMINAAATTLRKETDENSDEIQKVLDTVWVKTFFLGFSWFLKFVDQVFCLCFRRVILIIVAALMLLLAFLGFCKPTNHYNLITLS